MNETLLILILFKIILEKNHFDYDFDKRIIVIEFTHLARLSGHYISSDYPFVRLIVSFSRIRYVFFSIL